MKTIKNNQHNSFHWLLVVFIRLVHLIIFTPVSLYLAAFGFFFSQKTIEGLLTPLQIGKINSYCQLLPFFTISRTVFSVWLNNWYKQAPFWWSTVIGFPLMLTGVSIFIINLAHFYGSIFGSTYNLTHCPLCKNKIKVKDNRTF